MSIHQIHLHPQYVSSQKGDLDDVQNEPSNSLSVMPCEEFEKRVPNPNIIQDMNLSQIEKAGRQDFGQESAIEEVIDSKKKENLDFKENHFRNAITVSFRDLKYSVQIHNKKHKKEKIPKFVRRDILRGLTGICRPRELTAIMGASGAGKTTLLNILSFRTRAKGKNEFHGECLANGQKYDLGMFNKFAGYVMQNDILLDTMTPRETFQFAANLKIHATAKEKKKKVNQLIQSLKLERAADTFIGGVFSKGVSGGERKRTSIGLELMTDPSLLILDEPTSGLDSCTATVLIGLLKNLAINEGKTIIFTIHQPSSDIFHMFDNLMILAKGKLIYQGPTHSHIAVEYFSSIGYQCPEYSNPADYFIEIAHSKKNDDEKFEVMYKEYAEKISPKIEQEVVPRKEIVFSEKANSWLTSCAYISKRSFMNLLRNPILLRGRIAQTCFITFLICVLYFQVTEDMDVDDPLSEVNARVIYDINGGLFFFCISTFMTSAMSVVLTFPTERAVFLKEYGSNMYSVSAYYFGRSSTEIPFVLIFPILMTCVSYYIIGFNPAVSRFFFFMLIAVFVALAGNAMGLLIGCIFSDAKVATNLVPVILIPWMLFTGVYININEIPGWLRWLQYTSPFRYALEALMWNQYEGFPIGFNQLAIYGYTLGKWLSFILLMVLGMVIRLAALLCLKLLVKRLE